MPSHYAGVVYDVSLVISPLLGVVVSLLSYYFSGVTKLWGLRGGRLMGVDLQLSVILLCYSYVQCVNILVILPFLGIIIVYHHTMPVG